MKLLLGIEVIALFLGIKSFGNKNNTLDDIKLLESKSNNLFAIMVENSNGDFVESNSFPIGKYEINYDLSTCIDNNGNKIQNTLTYKNGIVTLKTNKTTFCYLYFNYNPYDLEINITNETVPKTSGYSVVSTCPNSNWSDKYQGIEFSNLINPVIKCNLTYNKKTFDESKKLSTIASTERTSGKGSIVNEGNAGFRYEGQDPNNYIWFNNELWRIIGVKPTKVDSSGTTENLVKIIRNSSIGGLAYDVDSSEYTVAWGSNTLYSLLNEYYFGKKDGTNTTGCYGFQTTAKAKCDYTEIGINGADYYGSMIKKVYWNTGSSNNAATASTVYGTEKATQTIYNYVGLMSASDYGYATSASHSTNLSSYNNATHTLNNWLYGQGFEWTNIQYSSNARNALYVDNDGFVSNINASNGYAVRPVLYLGADIYVSSGDGSKAAPYVISKKLK